MTKTIPKLSTLIKEKELNWVNPDITDDLFEIPNEIGTEFKLFHFDRTISSKEAVKKMKNDGFRAANIYELLTWKGWNESDFVITLGSAPKVRGNRFVPYLCGNDSARHLALAWWDRAWDAYCRFLGCAIKEKSDTENTELGDLGSLTLAIDTVRKAGYVLFKIEDGKLIQP